MPGKEKYIQASWQKEIFFVDLFFSKARFFRFLLNSSLLKPTPLFPERIAYTVTPEQTELVRQSFDAIWPVRRRLADQFYRRFFELAPADNGSDHVHQFEVLPFYSARQPPNVPLVH